MNLTAQFKAGISQTIPSEPGVYRFYNQDDELIYVGKAKNLRRRLGQYKNAKRRKAHMKMRKITQEAHRLEFETCVDEVTALHLETKLIQQHRPKWNVAGAFYFMYPVVGLKVDYSNSREGEVFICYTTKPELFEGFQYHGAFRSRRRVKEGFFALNSLLRLLGHSVSLPDLRKMGYPTSSRPMTYVYGFRQIPPEWHPLLESFLTGESFKAIEELSLLLLDRPTALKNSKETELLLKDIRRFWRHEILPLRKARLGAGYAGYPVPQKMRDFLFITSRYGAVKPSPKSPKKSV
ncbi:MAG: nucleotide excision repair endonuclease [Bdellovibrionales bacterium]|nr:nucleotide excision repair endonuclease [Bdellovibrionales bacterium]